MKNELTLEDFLKIFKKIQDEINSNVNFLCDLDSTIGDGDHGTTISKGFDIAIKEIENKNPSNISDLFITVGNAIIDNVGGVTGVVFGSFFISMGEAISKDKETVGLAELYKMFKNGLDASMSVGKGAKPGEKTMVDSIYPAVDSLSESLKLQNNLEDAIKNMSVAAKNGALNTKDMIATKGRARYLGERSLGFQDAGSESIAIIVNAFNVVF